MANYTSGHKTQHSEHLISKPNLGTSPGKLRVEVSLDKTTIPGALMPHGAEPVYKDGNSPRGSVKYQLLLILRVQMKSHLNMRWLLDICVLLRCEA